MKKFAGMLTVFLLLAGVCSYPTFAASDSSPHYVVTNDDIPPALSSSATFYTVETDGSLKMKQKVLTGGGGIAGGYFGAKRVVVLNSAGAECAYVSQAQSGQIVGIVIKTLKLGGHANGSKHDTGASNGVGMAMNSQYLYASFTDSNTIGTFKVKPGCGLKFVGDISVKGLQSGVIDGMALRGNLLVVTYGDGSIESFDISGGVPVSNNDEQNSTGSRAGNIYPSQVVITRDAHYALFGDTAVSTVIEVSDISSGKLDKTIVYRLGNAINSSNVLLSPDETLLYISNNQSGKVSAAFFDKSTGELTKGCTSGFLKGYVTDWSYTAGLALEETTGTGGVIYVAEFGGPPTNSSIAEVQVESSGGTCTLKERSKSPVADPNSPGLLSIKTFP